MGKESGRAREPDGEVRQRLLDVATDLFTRKGYAATSVREIVAAAGVTAPVLYYYFENKEGLFLKLLEAPWARLESEVDGAHRDGATAREKLQSLCQRIFLLFQSSIAVARLMYAISYGPPQGAPFFDCDVYHEKLRKTVWDLVEEGIAVGEFPGGNVEGMVWAVIGALNVAFEIELSHKDRSLGPDGLARVLEVVFRGMAAPEAGRKKR